MPHLPWWLEMLALAILSFMAAYVVNAARPAPLEWTADYRAAVVKSVAKEGLTVLDLPQTEQAWRAGSRLFVDARDPDDFASGHIPGAVNLPEEDLATGSSPALAGLAKDRALLVYCADLSCPKSKDLAQALKQMGYANLAVFPGGMEAWKTAGLAVESK
jgi:rhodanese-related sulfurtransferase